MLAQKVVLLIIVACKATVGMLFVKVLLTSDCDLICLFYSYNKLLHMNELFSKFKGELNFTQNLFDFFRPQVIPGLSAILKFL
jgi:hypothetical protein